MTNKLCDKCGIRHLEADCPVCHATQALSAKLISGIVDGFGLFLDYHNPVKKCSVCDITWDEVLKTGRLGCAQDYNTFKEELEPLLLKFHGTTSHTEN